MDHILAAKADNFSELYQLITTLHVAHKSGGNFRIEILKRFHKDGGITYGAHYYRKANMELQDADYYVDRGEKKYKKRSENLSFWVDVIVKDFEANSAEEASERALIWLQDHDGM